MLCMLCIDEFMPFYHVSNGNQSNQSCGIELALGTVSADPGPGRDDFRRGHSLKMLRVGHRRFFSKTGRVRVGIFGIWIVKFVNCKDLCRSLAMSRALPRQGWRRTATWLFRPRV